MTADDLYEEMKAALKHFGLRFHDRHLVTVIIQGDELIFRYRSRSVTIRTKE